MGQVCLLPDVRRPSGGHGLKGAQAVGDWQIAAAPRLARLVGAGHTQDKGQVCSVPTGLALNGCSHSTLPAHVKRLRLPGQLCSRGVVSSHGFSLSSGGC